MPLVIFVAVAVTYFLRQKQNDAFRFLTQTTRVTDGQTGRQTELQ